MTAGEFREVDHDLLADHVGGALKGTPEGARVERLIAENPAWHRAHADLTRAMESVSADLAQWGAVPEPMPAEVADRLTAAVTAALAAGSTSVSTGDPMSVSTGDPAPDEPSDGSAQPGRRPRSAADQSRPGPDQSRPGPDQARPGPDQARPDGGRGTESVRPRSRGPAPGARGRGAAPTRRRWSRIAGSVAVAAAAVAFVGFGVNRLVVPENAQDSGTTAGQARGTDDAAPATTGDARPRALLERSPERQLSTGTDYGIANLATLAGPLALRPTDDRRAETRAAPNAQEDGQGSSGGAGLGRLNDPAALAGCLDAIDAEHGQGPLTVEAVDYATFEAAPALIVVFTDQAAKRWAMAVGPACGLPGSGAAQRYATQVG